jgi:hypothetical protein
VNACEDFVDRLYDEDVRASLAGGPPIPADVASHLANCPACWRLWEESREDLPWLSRGLLEDPPPWLEVRALRAMGEALPPPAPLLLDWRSLALRAVAGAGLGVCVVMLAGPYLPALWKTLVVLTAVAASLAVELTLQGLDATSS